MLEVGLGGRLDAVNIVDAEAAIVCSIGLDHARLARARTSNRSGARRPASSAGSQLAVIADPPMTPGGRGRGRAASVRARCAPVRDYTGVWQRLEPALDVSQRERSTRFACRYPALPGKRQLANAAAAIATLLGHGRAAREAARSVMRSALAAAAGALPGGSRTGRVDTRCGAQRARGRGAGAEPARASLCRSHAAGGRHPGRQGRRRDCAPSLPRRSTEWILCGIDAPRGLTAAQLAARSPDFATAGQVRRTLLQACVLRPGRHGRAIASSSVDRS